VGVNKGKHKIQGGYAASSPFNDQNMEALYSEKITADTVTFARDSHHNGWNEEDETQAG